MERFVRDSGIIMLEDEARLIDDSFYVIGRQGLRKTRATARTSA